MIRQLQPGTSGDLDALRGWRMRGKSARIRLEPPQAWQPVRRVLQGKQSQAAASRPDGTARRKAHGKQHLFSDAVLRGVLWGITCLTEAVQRTFHVVDFRGEHPRLHSSARLPDFGRPHPKLRLHAISRVTWRHPKGDGRGGRMASGLRQSKPSGQRRALAWQGLARLAGANPPRTVQILHTVRA